MKFPYLMLRDYVETTLDAEALGDLLTMAGFELEGIEEVEGDQVLDIKVVSNRGDGLSILGLSRELLAKDSQSRATPLYEAAVAHFPAGPAPDGGNFPVRIETEDCARYVALEFGDIQNGTSPEWLQRRIRQAGWRPISTLVDLTNYVLLELGQPLHVFDLDTLAGEEIVVRKAAPGETLTTLNGQEHQLQPNQMMICDAERPVAAAGIMGGAETEVSTQTKRVLLESAQFLNTSVRKTRKQMGLSTEASYRFERYVDPEGVAGAARRFAQLALELGAAKPVGGLTDLYPRPPAARTLEVSVPRCEALLAMAIGVEESARILTGLGFGVEARGNQLHLTVPTWRPDVVRDEDVAEEIGRVYGFERIPERLPSGTTLLGGPSGIEAWIDGVRARALRAGFSQTISHSLRDLHALDAASPRVGPRNPGSPEMAYLRNALMASLGDNARRNGGRDLCLFEVGRVFSESAPGQYREVRHLALLAQGALREPYLGSKEESASFYSMKSALEESLGSVPLDFSIPTSLDPRLHPTQQAQVLAAGQALGVLGTIHPDVAETASLPADTVLAEVDLELAYSARAEGMRLKPISRNPAVRRDIAILIDKSVPYARLESTIVAAGGDLLEKQWLFDVYEGQGIPDGKHSLAIALQLRKMGGNFTDEEANQVRETIVAALAPLGASTR